MAMNQLSMNWDGGAGPARLNSRPLSHHDHILPLFSFFLFLLYSDSCPYSAVAHIPKDGREAKLEAAIKRPCLVYLFSAEITADILPILLSSEPSPPDSNLDDACKISPLTPFLVYP